MDTKPFLSHEKSYLYRSIRRKQSNRDPRKLSPRNDQTFLVCCFQPDGSITYANDAYCSYHKTKQDALIGTRVLRFVLEEDREKVRKHIASLDIENPIAAIQYRVLLPDGKIRWQEWIDRAIFDRRGQLLEYQSIGCDLTEEIEIKEALQKSRERYRKLINKMYNAFALSEVIYDQSDRPWDCRFLDLNPAFEHIIGMKKKNVIGRTVREIFPGTESFWIDQCGQVALTGEPIHFNQCSRLFDNFFEVIAYSPQKGQVAVIFTDITLRVQMEDALRESESNFKAIAENANDGLIITMADGRQVYVNQQASEITGYPKSELLKIGFYDLAHPHEVDKIRSRNKLRFEGNSVPNRYETLLVKKDGNQVPIEINTSKTIWKGDPAALNIIRDITLRKRLEEARGRMSIELERRVKERTNELKKTADILEKKQKELLKHKLDLEKANKELMQTNTALTVLARNIDKKKDDAKNRIAQTISSQIIPLVEEIKTHKIPEKSHAALEMLSAYLNDLTRGASRGHDVIISLSSMELRVAMMIKNGFTSEEIARILHISSHTVKTHRRSIRKKLKIKNSNISLASYLKLKFGKHQELPEATQDRRVDPPPR
jgi:PAS domain S-box-containing protein